MSRFVLHNPDDLGADVWVLCGQSNEVGFGDGLDTAYLDTADPRIVQWPGSGAYVGSVVAAIDPLFHREQHAGAAGHAMTFARRYVRTIPANRRVMLVPCAAGSTGFTTSSASSPPSGYTFVAAGSWDPAKGDGGISLYQNAIDSAKAALAENPANRLGGFIWCQGEADIGISGPAYQAKLDALIAGFRANIPGGTGVPFLVQSMVPDWYSQQSNRQAIAAVHIDTPNRNTLTGFSYGPTGYVYTGDGLSIHFTSAGQRINGRRLFDALLRARTNVLGTAPVTPAAPTLTQSGSTATAAWGQVSGRATDFNVRYSTNAGTSWTTLTRAQSIDVAAAITGLAQPSTLTVQVRTVNEQGVSAWSPSSAPLSMIAAPTQVAGLSAGTPASYSVPLTWTTGSGGASFLVEKSTDGGNTWTTSTTVTTDGGATASGLSASTGYKFRVTASNAGGTAAPSAATGTVTTASAPMLLDSITSAAAAAVKGGYSINRKLRTAYAGNCIQVRRSSDNTTQDIGFAAGGVLDTVAMSTFMGSSDLFLSKVYDQTVNAKDMVQATAANQPKIATAGVLNTDTNGKIAPVWNGTSSVLTAAALGIYAAGAATAVSVVKGAAQANKRWFGEAHTTSSTAMYTLGGSGTGTAHALTTIQNEAGTLIVQPEGTLTAYDGTTHQQSTVDTGTALSRWIDTAQDGTASTSYTRSGTLAPDVSFIGALVRTAPAVWFAGTVFETVAFGSALSTADRQVCEANQKAFYGTP